MAKGKKTCPKCSGICSTGSSECSCGHIFYQKKIKPEKDPNIKIASRGKKFCPGCDEQIGIRTSSCSCGHVFYEKKIKSEIKVKSHKKTAPKATSSDGEQKKVGSRGRKICPNCKVESGVRKHVCECGYDFILCKISSKAVEKVDESIKVIVEQAEVSSNISLERKEKREMLLSGPEVVAAVGRESNPMTKREHADRILGYGKSRATNLLRCAGKGTWTHVDWDYVKEQLGVVNG